MSVYLPSGQFDCKVSLPKGAPLGLHGQELDVPERHLLCRDLARLMESPC